MPLRVIFVIIYFSETGRGLYGGVSILLAAHRETQATQRDRHTVPARVLATLQMSRSLDLCSSSPSRHFLSFRHSPSPDRSAQPDNNNEGFPTLKEQLVHFDHVNRSPDDVSQSA